MYSSPLNNTWPGLPSTQATSLPSTLPVVTLAPWVAPLPGRLEGLRPSSVETRRPFDGTFDAARVRERREVALAKARREDSSSAAHGEPKRRHASDTWAMRPVCVEWLPESESADGAAPRFRSVLKPCEEAAARPSAATMPPLASTTRPATAQPTRYRGPMCVFEQPLTHGKIMYIRKWDVPCPPENTTPPTRRWYNYCGIS